MYYDELSQLESLLRRTMTTMCNEMKVRWIDKQNDLARNEKLSDNLKFDEISRKDKRQEVFRRQIRLTWFVI